MGNLTCALHPTMAFLNARKKYKLSRLTVFNLQAADGNDKQG